MSGWDSPDGEVDRVPPDDLVEAVWAVLEPEQPTVVWTFGPDGIFGHPDHIAIGAATDAAFARGVRDDGPAFRRLLHGAVPESVFQRWNTNRAELGLQVWDPTRMYHMRGVPDEEIGMVVDCRAVSRRIIAGLREHRSQHHVLSDDPDDVETWQRAVRRESHVVAWPPRAPGSTLLTDVFDGLGPSA